MEKIDKNRKLGLNFAIRLVLIFAIIFTSLNFVFAQPSGPTITILANETKSIGQAGLINTSGGTISTVYLNATTQNKRWKAYVGNVTGSLTLDDASDNSIFDWQLTSIIGEVYATRAVGSVNWSGINCSNSTHISNENIALNHTNADDNITATFDDLTHAGFYTGTREILTNTCFSVNTYVNSTIQSEYFEEVLLYDGTNETNGNLVYATPLEQDIYGFDNQTYDFQMIVPERGLDSWTSSTAYYFYVELA